MINEMEKDVARVLISEEQIRQRVKEMGAQISEDYAGKDVVLLCILKGAVQFFSDLSRQMTCNLEMDFMSISSYGNGTRTSGIVRISKDMDLSITGRLVENLHEVAADNLALPLGSKDMDLSITGRHVLIVEDIMDSGLTLNHLTNILKTRQPASLRIACLLDKPERRECAISPDYVGFVIPNEFVIGYGLDYMGHFRNLPYVGVKNTDNM